MICTFTPGAPPVPEKTILINLDFTYKVICCNIHVPRDTFSDIPNTVSTAEHFLKLLDYVDHSVVCPGILCDDQMRQLVMSGGRNGVFRDQHGGIRGKINENATSIRTIACSGIIMSST